MRDNVPGIASLTRATVSSSPRAMIRRVGKGATAPCPPSTPCSRWWARFALPTLRFLVQISNIAFVVASVSIPAAGFCPSFASRLPS